MKIGLVTMRTDPTRGGAERYTIDLAHALVRERHDVTMLASSFVDIPAGVRRVPLPARGLTRVRRYEHFLDALDVHLDATRYDIVHAMLPVRRCDVYHPHAGLARAMVANDLLLATVFNPRRARGALVEGRLLDAPNAPLVLCLSEYVKRTVRQWYALDDSHLPILFNAVDLEKYDPTRLPGARRDRRSALGLGEEHTVAAFVGHDFERKGLREAIVAMGRLRSANDAAAASLRLLIVGRARVARYLALAAELGVREQVIALGDVADSYSVYRAADLVVLPTKHDPCSLVVLEALAMGVPVISTRFNGACEIMTSGVHGVVLDDPADVDALTSAIRRLLDAGARRRMSQACLELRPVLAYERHLRTLLRIYESVTSNTTARAS